MSRRRPQPSRRQRGSVAVETALALPILLGVGLLGSDMQRIHTERIRLENAAGSMALTIAAQPQLSVAGLDALAAAAMQGHSDAQQLIVMSVRPSGRVDWLLQRGGADGLCPAPASGGVYAGALPEDPPEQADEDTATLSMVVVLACRDTRAVALSGALPMPDLLQTASIFRATAQNIELDEVLQAESDASGLAYSEPST